MSERDLYPSPSELARAEFDIQHRELAEWLLQQNPMFDYRVDPVRYINAQLSEMWKRVRAKRIDRMERIFERAYRNRREGIDPRKDGDGYKRQLDIHRGGEKR